MKTTALLVKSLVISGVFALQAQAQEISLEHALRSFVEQAITATSEELQMEVQQVVANTVYRFSLTGETRSGVVSVTDIATATNFKPATEQLKDSIDDKVGE